MKRIALIFFIIILILATTLTKNSTKKIDKKIFNLKEDIRLLTNQCHYPTGDQLSARSERS